MKLIKLCIIFTAFLFAVSSSVNGSSYDPQSDMTDFHIGNSLIPTSYNPIVSFFNAEITSYFDLFAFNFYIFEIEKVSGNLEVSAIDVMYHSPLEPRGSGFYYAAESTTLGVIKIFFQIDKLDFIPGTESSYKLKFKYNDDITKVNDEEWSETDEFTISIESPQLTGTLPVCNSGQSLTIANYPSGVTGISWSCSPLQKLPNGDTGFSVYTEPFKSFSSGYGWLKPTYIFPSGLTLDCVEFKTWIGPPSMPITNPTGYPTFEMTLAEITTITVSSAPGASTNIYDWTVTGSIERTSSTPHMSCTVEATSLGTGNYYVTSSNACGTSWTGGGTVNVSTEGGGGPPHPLSPIINPLSITPNPANEEVEISINEETSEIMVLTVDDNTADIKYDLTIYNNSGFPIYSGKLQNKKVRLNVSGWNKGVYHVSVSGKNKNYTGILIVE